MGSPTIFSGSYTKLLTSKGILKKNGQIIENDGVLNYIKNGTAEINTTGWATYADAAGTVPVNGTGGAPTITWTRTTSSPRTGVADFLFTKDAANRQGEGASYDFTIENSDQGKLLSGRLQYFIASGTYADNDVAFFIYDVTNSALIYCTPYQLINTTVDGVFNFVFQTATNSTSYRLIIHQASTSASAFTIKFDQFFVGPQQITYGTVISDWTSYTPTGTFTTNTTYAGKWRRVGDSMELNINIAFSGAPNAVTLTDVFLPSGYTIDTAKLGGGASTNVEVGSGSGEVTNSYPLTVRYQTTTSIRPLTHNYSGDGAGTDVITAGISNTAPASWGAGDLIDIIALVPIAGWGTSLAVSGVDAGDGRIVDAKYTGAPPTGTLNGSFNTVTFGTKVKDSHNAYSSGSYTVQVSGDYAISAAVGITGTFVLNNQSAISIHVDGTEKTSTYQYAGGAITADYLSVTDECLPLTAGQVVTIKVKSGATGPGYSSNAPENFFTIARIQGATSIAAGETVALRYTTAAGQSIATSTTTIVDFGTKDFDTGAGGTVTTGSSWKWTSNRTQKVKVYANVLFSASAVLNTQFNARLYKTGVEVARRVIYKPTASNIPWGVEITDEMSMVAGDYIDFRVFQDTGGSVALQADATNCYISITGDGV